MSKDNGTLMKCPYGDTVLAQLASLKNLIMFGKEIPGSDVITSQISVLIQEHRDGRELIEQEIDEIFDMYKRAPEPTWEELAEYNIDKNVLPKSPVEIRKLFIEKESLVQAGDHYSMSFSILTPHRVSELKSLGVSRYSAMKLDNAILYVSFCLLTLYRSEKWNLKLRILLDSLKNALLTLQRYPSESSIMYLEALVDFSASIYGMLFREYLGITIPDMPSGFRGRYCEDNSIAESIQEILNSVVGGQENAKVQ